MTKLKKLEQQIEGTVDQLIGTIEQKNGDTIKGGIHRMEGGIKKATAPLDDLDDDKADERV